MTARELNELIDQYQAALVLYARQWCVLAEDAVQEAFIDLAHTPNFPVSPVAWLYTATRRKAQNLARAESRRKRHQQQAASEKSTWFEAQQDQGHALGDSDDLQRGLERLDDLERQLVVARTWGELSFEQLGEVLGCSVGTAHRRYVEALRKLKRFLSSAVESDAVREQVTTTKPDKPGTKRSSHRLVGGEFG